MSSNRRPGKETGGKFGEDAEVDVWSIEEI